MFLVIKHRINSALSGVEIIKRFSFLILAESFAYRCAFLELNEGAVVLVYNGGFNQYLHLNGNLTKISFYSQYPLEPRNILEDNAYMYTVIKIREMNQLINYRIFAIQVIDFLLADFVQYDEGEDVGNDEEEYVPDDGDEESYQYIDDYDREAEYDIVENAMIED